MAKKSEDKKKGVDVNSTIKWVSGCIVIVVIAILIIIWMLTNHGKGGSGNGVVGSNITVNSTVIKAELKKAGELVSSKYYYNESSDYKKDTKLWDTIVVPFSADKCRVEFEGVVGLGMALDEIDVVVDDKKKQIVVTLPEIKVLFHEITDGTFKVTYIVNSIITDTNLNDYDALVQEIKKSKEDILMSDKSILKEVREDAEENLSGFLASFVRSSGYELVFEGEDYEEEESEEKK